MNTDYQKQGTDFLEQTGTTMTVKFVGNDKYFDDDKEARDIYRITLERKGRKYSFRFGQSIANSAPTTSELNRLENLGVKLWSKKYRAVKNRAKAPSAYDVLTCLTKHDPGTIDDFASEYGYNDVKPSKLMKTYSAVVEEWEGVKLLFSDVLEKLQEVQ